LRTLTAQNVDGACCVFCAVGFDAVTAVPGESVEFVKPRACAECAYTRRKAKITRR